MAVYLHKRWYVAEDRFAYWSHTAADPTGAQYSGSPAYGSLTGPVVIQKIEATDAQPIVLSTPLNVSPEIADDGFGTISRESFELS